MSKHLIVLAFLLPTQFVQGAEIEQLFQKVSRSVWVVRTFDQRGSPFSIGSAVMIDAKTLITNCHVLRQARSFILQKDTESFKGTLQHADVDRDLCIVSVTDAKFDAPVVELASGSSFLVGQRVFAVGNPFGLEMTLSDGLISRLQRDEESEIESIQTSAPLSPGSSGGGLFDMEGRLIGITQRGVTAIGSQNLNFALPIDWLKGLPERSKLQIEEYYAAKARK